MSAPVAVGLIGAGWIGRFHGESVALRIPGTRLVAVADPVPGAAASLIERVSPDARPYTDALELIADPNVEAVLISTPRINSHRSRGGSSGGRQTCLL